MHQRGGIKRERQEVYNFLSDTCFGSHVASETTYGACNCCPALTHPLAQWLLELTPTPVPLTVTCSEDNRCIL